MSKRLQMPTLSGFLPLERRGPKVIDRKPLCQWSETEIRIAFLFKEEPQKGGNGRKGLRRDTLNTQVFEVPCQLLSLEQAKLN